MRHLRDGGLDLIPAAKSRNQSQRRAAGEVHRPEGTHDRSRLIAQELNLRAMRGAKTASIRARSQQAFFPKMH
jgi:hypothetical protein